MTNPPDKAFILKRYGGSSAPFLSDFNPHTTEQPLREISPQIKSSLVLHKQGGQTLTIHNLCRWYLQKEGIDPLTSASKEKLFLAICRIDDLVKMGFFHEQGYLAAFDAKIIAEGFFKTIEKDSVTCFKRLFPLFPQQCNPENSEIRKQALKYRSRKVLAELAGFFL